MKFLDDITSTPGLRDPVTIQGPDDQFANWALVEKHYNQTADAEDSAKPSSQSHAIPTPPTEEQTPADSAQQDEQMATKLVEKLSLEPHDRLGSPTCTPPMSPSSSAPQSTKPSPEIISASVSKHDASPVPPALKGLINPVVWFMYQDTNKTGGKEVVFLTNSADTNVLIRDFGITPKTTHQLRAAVNAEEKESRVQKQSQKKQTERSVQAQEPKTLFRYEEESSEDEEEEQVIFQPRTRGGPRPGSSGRGIPNPKHRGRGHSPSTSISSPPQPQPQIPVEEIDPDSFDRGSFARGSTPLVNVGGPPSWPHHHMGRGNFRGQQLPFGPRGRGFRGNASPNAVRGRGRLFVP